MIRLMSSSFDITPLIRENIRSLVPYSSARNEFSGQARVWLDANENPFNSPYNRYPDPMQNSLKAVISDQKGVAAENLFLGNGSDEGIDLLFRVLCTPGMDNVITVDPTYGMYAVAARINDVERKSVLLREDFSLDPETVIGATDERTRMIFLCSPNNPTSNSFKREAMEEIIDSVHCMVVVDEAYIDFSEQPGLLSLVGKKKNLVLLQTLSKAFGLAGIRLGMVIASEELIHYLNKVKYPYNVNSLTIEKAIKELKEQERAASWVEEIQLERLHLHRCLESFQFVLKVFPSDANFLLVKVNRPAHLYHYLLEKGIVIRDRSSVPLCDGCVRITVGTRDENRLLCEALKMYQGKTAENQEL